MSCLNLLCSGLAIPCSTSLHGNGWVGACSLSHATFPSHCGVTGGGCIHLFLHKCLSLTGADLWPPGWCGACQVQAQVELAFPGYNSMVVATQLDPPCKLAQSLEFDPSECQELMLHVGHVLEWHLFFDSLPLLLILPQMVEELGLQLVPLRLHAGGVVVQVEASENVAQVLPPPHTPIVSDVLQRVSRSPLSACGGGWRDITRCPSWASTLLVGHRLIGLPDGGPLLSSSGMAGRPTAIASALGSLSPTYICVLTISGNRLGGRRVKGDS